LSGRLVIRPAAFFDEWTMRANKHFGELAMQVWDFADLIIKSRLAKALDEGASRYPIFRELRFAARIELEVLLDAVALEPSWRAQRVNAEAMVLDGDGVFAAAFGSRKIDYCSCVFYIWAADIARAEHTRWLILEKAGSTRISEPTFSVDWHFNSGSCVESTMIEEVVSERLHDRAYPEIEGGVYEFIRRYLDAPETVLVLQGPPGTGKTRLIRAILGEMSSRKGKQAKALYTADLKTLGSDEIFVKFITGEEDAFVIEDADHILKPRADGNDHMHRFLTIADGVVRAQGRKIIFSTNLPNVGDLDEALIRPGRCFARIHVRALTGEEARLLAEEIAAGDADKLHRARQALVESRKRSVAEVYQLLRS
jgi:hypothetical protein